MTIDSTQEYARPTAFCMVPLGILLNAFFLMRYDNLQHDSANWFDKHFLTLGIGFLAIMAFWCFLAATKGGILIWRLFSLPVLFAIMMVIAYANSQIEFSSWWWFATFFVNFIGPAIVTIILIYRLSPAPA